ncbi:hypothetical protein C8R45DRAFT_927156 [Mycena sanguinolenta]|nr:hypothetical protein C8R45DRAFT_927156 [Mycena sanguinolenta]
MALCRKARTTFSGKTLGSNFLSVGCPQSDRGTLAEESIPRGFGTDRKTAVFLTGKTGPSRPSAVFDGYNFVPQRGLTFPLPSIWITITALIPTLTELVKTKVIGQYLADLSLPTVALKARNDRVPSRRRWERDRRIGGLIPARATTANATLGLGTHCAQSPTGTHHHACIAELSNLECGKDLRRALIFKARLPSFWRFTFSVVAVKSP